MSKPKDNDTAAMSGVDSSAMLDVIRAVQGELSSYIGDTDPDLMIWDDDTEETREMTDEEIRSEEPIAWCHMQLVQLLVSLSNVKGDSQSPDK